MVLSFSRTYPLRPLGPSRPDHDGFVGDDDDDDGDGVDECGDGYSEGDDGHGNGNDVDVVMDNLYSSMITASCSSTVSRLCGNRPTCFMSLNSSRVFAAI